ncbi:hypothetical protein ACFV1F_47430 [Streptomyces sp. NPDC059590]|uniref:hypothetical protein n=1 Tax=Streptomyces sp. NPDC059590 TaxID=3346877 RepID=UPI003676DE4E
MSSTGTIKRSRKRRASESAYGLLLVTKNVVMALLALFVLVAGVWYSWATAKPAMFTKNLERGTITVAACDDDWCTGTFTPMDGSGRARAKVRIDKAVTDGRGERLLVALKPGSDEAVRTGMTGILHAWVPFAGSLLLAALMVAGGLRLRRTAWALGLTGAALLAASFATLTF